MNITPNYQLRMFNSRVSNQQQTNPSFAGAKQYTAPVARLVTGAEALGLLALMSSNLNPGKKEEIKVEPPTREGFQAILKKDGIGRREEKWLRAYDINAEKQLLYIIWRINTAKELLPTNGFL